MPSFMFSEKYLLCWHQSLYSSACDFQAQYTIYGRNNKILQNTLCLAYYLIHIMDLVPHLIPLSKMLSILFDCTSSTWTVFLFHILSNIWVDGCMNMSMYVYNTITLCYIDKYMHCQMSYHVLSYFE